MDRAEVLARSWTSNADVWAKAVRSHAIESRRLVTDDAVVAAVLDCGGTRVLDVGCGEGWLARRLSAEGREVVGFDGSRRLVELAIEGGGGTFELLDYDAFAADPTRLGRDFDVAVANFSLLGQPLAELLRALRRVVAPRGRLVIQTVHPAGVGAADDGWREEHYEPLAPLAFEPMPWFFRTRASWVRELSAAGWRLAAAREPTSPATGAPASLILIAA